MRRDLVDYEKLRFQEFKIIKEYPNYYLCGRYDDNGKLLYKECFSRFEIDGVPEYKKDRKCGCRTF